MRAPLELVTWMATHEAKSKDETLPHVYKYHPRSDSHSVELCELIMRDLINGCADLRAQASRRDAAYGINIPHTWSSTGKAKTLDLAIGVPNEPLLLTAPGQIPKVTSARRSRGVTEVTNALSRLMIACEAKAVMTEHKKSQPRVFDELSSSHEIVHQGDQESIAAGIVMVNIASAFVSPLRQKDPTKLHFSVHKQPRVAASMIQHLRGLRIRDEVGQVGFDAFCVFVVDCDNQSGCTLHTHAPAPQPGDPLHYDTFIERITRFYTERFGDRRRGQ